MWPNEPKKKDDTTMQRSRLLLVSAMAIAVLMPRLALAGTGTNGDAALAKSNLRLTAPIEHWDEAVPLGNGLLGGLLWGGGRNLKLSLDRGDLWDNRTHEMLRRDD